MKSGQRNALLIMAVFIVPLIGAILLFQYRDYFHFKSTNKGDLIIPPVEISVIPETPYWQIIFLTPAICDSACEKNIYYVNQIHTALGKNNTQLQPFILLAKENIDLLSSLQKAYPKPGFLLLNPAQIAAFNQALPSQYQAPTQGAYYLVDPRGYVMMHYAYDTPPKHILTDLKRLVKGDA